MSQQVGERLAGAYAWPPRPIEDPEEAAAILAERIQAAYDDLEAERLMVLASLTMLRKPQVDAWLKEFQGALLVFLDAITENVERFLTLHVGPRYAAGVRVVTGDQPMLWTQPHTLALTSLATDTYSDFLERAREAERVSEAFVRAVRSASATEIPKLAAGGRTARQAADRLEEKLLTEYGITEVTYRNGARVSARHYAQMVARTKSAVAYNAGTLNEAHSVGIGFVEVFDGADCGWRWHDDPDKANGTVRHVTDAATHAISHPNCTRAFGPRPDIRTKAEAKAAEPSTTEEQRADQRTNVDYFSSAPARTPGRAAQVRRARSTAARQARQLGVTDPEQIGDIIARVFKDRGLT